MNGGARWVRQQFSIDHLGRIKSVGPYRPGSDLAASLERRDRMNMILLFVGAVIIACILLKPIAAKLPFPTLLIFIALGMFLGSGGPLHINFNDFKATESVCTAALIFIMFYGGFNTNIERARPVAVPAVLLSTAGVVITAGLTAVFAHVALRFDWPLALISSGAYLLCALGTTWYVVHAELQKPAAELIRPRAPKAGKRILLERLPLIWDRLPFLHKVSIRNILRFKKRMVMMMIGIGGCTALLITGFGIQDSISSVVDYQYDEITRYDAAVTFQHALSGSEREDFLAVCEKSGAEGCLFVAEKSLDASAGGTVKTTNVVCPESGSVDGFIDLHTQEKTPIPYPQDGGCIISRGLAQALRLSAGDTIILQTGDMRRTELTVEAVFENYVYNYVYLTQTTWQDVFGEAPGYEAAWVNYQTDEDAQAASAALAGAKNAAAVTLSLDFRSRVATMMQSLQYIVLVVVLGAAALAFIVLYNLTNINITEREREIATIKVLGFYDGETNRYVFRENIILTVLGALVGLPMGKLLHAYVMGQIKIDLMCFDVRVAPLSYLISAALTLVFGLLVNLALRRKIRTIDMSQALKSIE